MSPPDDDSQGALWPPLDHPDRVGSERHFDHSITPPSSCKTRTRTACSALGASASRCHSPDLSWLHPAILDASVPTKRDGLRRPNSLEVLVAHLWHTRVRNPGQQGQPASTNQAQDGGSRAFRAGFGRSHNPSVVGSSPTCPTPSNLRRCPRGALHSGEWEASSPSSSPSRLQDIPHGGGEHGRGLGLSPRHDVAAVVQRGGRVPVSQAFLDDLHALASRQQDRGAGVPHATALTPRAPASMPNIAHDSLTASSL